MRITIKNKKIHQQAFISIFAIFFSAIIISVLTALYVLIVKQIEIMNLDYSSFQSMFTADTAFECILYKELNSDLTNSIFLPNHTLGYCGTDTPTDMNFETGKEPVVVNNRSKSTLDINFSTDQGDFCAVVTADRISVDPASLSAAPVPNTLSISGQSKKCGDSTQKVIERVIEFIY